MRLITVVALLCLTACNNGLSQRQRNEVIEIAHQQAQDAVVNEAVRQAVEDTNQAAMDAAAATH